MFRLQFFVGVEVRENVVSLCQILSMHEGVEESQIMRNSPIFPTPLEFPVWLLAWIGFWPGAELQCLSEWDGMIGKLWSSPFFISIQASI